ncbi:hypothetical protein K457DRAFT_142134, partial [Linnemannia elongata AG-77]
MLCHSLFPFPSLTYPLPLVLFSLPLFPSHYFCSRPHFLSLICLPLSFQSTLSPSTLTILVLF